MGEYAKALLEEDGDYRDRAEALGRHQVALGRAFVLFDAAVCLALLLLFLPHSALLWPPTCGLFLLTLYAFRRNSPSALRPLLVLLMFSLSTVPALFLGLLLLSVRDANWTAQLLASALSPIPLAADSLFGTLLTVHLGLLFATLFIYWQLRTLWKCQQHFREKRDESAANRRGYLETCVPDAFLDPTTAAKQPLRESREETRVSVAVLPDYQVFSLQQEEATNSQGSK